MGFFSLILGLWASHVHSKLCNKAPAFPMEITTFCAPSLQINPAAAAISLGVFIGRAGQSFCFLKVRFYKVGFPCTAKPKGFSAGIKYCPRFMLVENVHNLSVEIITNTGRQAACQDPPIAFLCQR